MNNSRCLPSGDDLRKGKLLDLDGKNSLSDVASNRVPDIYGRLALLWRFVSLDAVANGSIPLSDLNKHGMLDVLKHIDVYEKLVKLHESLLHGQH